MQSAAALERTRLERGLAFLATIGNNAPFVGLFGTVVGVIHAFEELGHAAPGHGATSTGQVASQAVMAGIAEALVATAVGIAVALPAVAAYNYLQRRVSALLSGTDVLSNLVLAYIGDDLARGGVRARQPGGLGWHRRVTTIRGGIISGINVTPLVDVMLVLLVIFVVTAKIIVTPGRPAGPAARRARRGGAGRPVDHLAGARADAGQRRAHPRRRDLPGEGQGGAGRHAPTCGR